MASVRPQSFSCKTYNPSSRQPSLMSDLEQENQQLKHQLKQSDNNRLIIDNQKEISRLHAVISSHEADIAQREMKINELKQNLSNKNDAMKNLLPKLQKLQNIVKQQKDTISLLKTENQSLKAENTSFRTRRESSISFGTSLSIGESELKQRLAKFKQALTKRNNEYKALNDKLENVQRQNRQLIEIVKLQDIKLKQKNDPVKTTRNISSQKNKNSESNINNTSLILQNQAQDISLNESIQELIESQAIEKALQENCYMKAKNEAISFQAKQINQLQKDLKAQIDENQKLREIIENYKGLEEELESVKTETQNFKEMLQQMKNPM